MPLPRRYASALLRDPARILRVRLARERIGDLADQRERRHLGRGVEDRARGVGHEQHVALGDPLPAADRRAVEAEPLLERRLVEAVDRQRDVLPRAEQVAELQVDHRGACLERPREGLVPGRRLSDVVPRLQLRHSCAPFVLDQQKSPTTSRVVRPHCLRGRLRRRPRGPHLSGGCGWTPEPSSRHLLGGPGRVGIGLLDDEVAGFAPRPSARHPVARGRG